MSHQSSQDSNSALHPLHPSHDVGGDQCYREATPEVAGEGSPDPQMRHQSSQDSNSALHPLDPSHYVGGDQHYREATPKVAGEGSEGGHLSSSDDVNVDGSNSDSHPIHPSHHCGTNDDGSMSGDGYMNSHAYMTDGGTHASNGGSNLSGSQESQSPEEDLQIQVICVHACSRPLIVLLLATLAATLAVRYRHHEHWKAIVYTHLQPVKHFEHSGYAKLQPLAGG